MDAIEKLFSEAGFANLSWQNIVMFGIGGLLIFLAVKKRFDPLPLIPIGFGAILANLPLAEMSAASPKLGAPPGGILQVVYNAGIDTKFLPPVIFLGVGALTDFRPLLSRPIRFRLGAAAQFGIFFAAHFIPKCTPLLGMLMFGNLLRESGVTDRLKKTAGGSMVDIVTIFLGLVVGATMVGELFLLPTTLGILVLGAFAFGVSTFGGVLFAKLLNAFLPAGKKINPCIGAAGVSAVPMAARLVQDFVSRETDGRVNPLMAAMGPNVAGVIGSAVAAGVFLALFG